MEVSTLILGWIGIIIFLIILLSYRRMAKNNEFALLHMLMALMYAMWLPLPFTLIRILKADHLQIGAIFGVVYLFMLVITMTFQAGHITFIVKKNDDKLITPIQSEYMMFTLSNPFEALVNVFKCMWALFLALAFWDQNESMMAILMTVFSLLIFYYLAIMINSVLVKQIKLFSKVKPNMYLINIETFLFFFALLIFITFMT